MKHKFLDSIVIICFLILVFSVPAFATDEILAAGISNVSGDIKTDVSFSAESEIMYNTYIDQSYVAIKVQTDEIPNEVSAYGVAINGNLYEQTSPLIGGEYIVDIAGLNASSAYIAKPYYKLADTIYYGEQLAFSTKSATEKMTLPGNIEGNYFNAPGENIAIGYGLTYTYGGIDFVGKSHEQWLQSTYRGRGWAYIFGDEQYGAEKINSPILTNIYAQTHNIQAWAVPTISEDGLFGVLTFYVRNVSASEITNLKFGAAGDIQIGDEDEADIFKMDYGVNMTDENNNTFILLCQGKDNYGTTPISSLWFGDATKATASVYDDIEEDSLIGMDSGLAFSWQNITLKPGEIKAFTVAIGIGEADIISSAFTAKAEIDYLEEKLIGLEADTEYIIREQNNEYKVSTGADGSLPLADSLIGYDFIGKEITIVKADASEAQGQIIIIADRAQAEITLNVPLEDEPYLPDDLDVTATENSLTIKAEDNQEFSIDGGKSWVSDGDGDGEVFFADLASGKEYLILARVKATESSFASASAEFKVICKPMLSIDEITVQTSVTYSDLSGNSPISVIGDAEITYASDLNGEYKPALDYQDAGKHSFYYRVQKDGYYDYYNQAEIEILPAVPTESDFTFALPDNLIYDGTAKAVKIEPAAGINGMGKVNISYYDSADNELPRAINAGAYTVKISVEAGKNYTAASNLSNAAWQFTIAKAKVEIPTIESKTYSGEKQTADIRNTSEYEVKNNDGGINVGEYPVVLALKDAENYQWAEENDAAEKELKFIITKAENAWQINPNIADWNYGENAAIPFGQAKFGTVSFTYSDSENGEYSAEHPTAAGNYWLKAVVEETENYSGLEEKLSFAIKKIAQDELIVSGIPEKIYYGDCFTVTAEGGSGNGRITWSADGAAIITPAGEVTITGVGEFSLHASKAEDNNYAESTAMQKGTAAKRPLIITATKIADKIYDGTKTAVIEAAGTVNNAVASDGITVLTQAEFTDENAGDSKEVCLNYELRGNNVQFYDFAQTAKTTANIEQKNISEAAVILADDLVYNGKKQTKDIVSVIADGLTVTYDVEGNTGINADEYELIITGKGNFCGSKSLPWTIAKAVVQKKDFVLQKPNDLVYDGKAKNAEVVLVNDMSGMGEITIKYFADGVEGEAVNAGKYIVKIAVSEGANYQATAEDIELGEFSIAKAQPALTISADPQAIKGQSEVTVTVNGIPSEGSVALSCVNEKNESLPVKGSGNIFTATLPNVESSYTFTAVYGASTNYNQASVQCVVKAEKQAQAMVPQRSLTFETNGGSILPTITRNYGTTIVLAEYIPYKKGYEFSGWYKDSNLTEKAEYLVLDYDQCVYAKWIAEKTANEAAAQFCMVLTINNPRVQVNAAEILSDAAPVIVNNRTFTPARLVAEQLGAKVEWNQVTRTVTITMKETTIILIADSTTAYVNGMAVKMDAAAFIADGRIYTPARFVAEHLGACVVWQEEKQTITISR